MDGKRQGIGEVKQADHIPEYGGYYDDQYSDRADMSRVNRVRVGTIKEALKVFAF